MQKKAKIILEFRTKHKRIQRIFRISGKLIQALFRYHHSEVSIEVIQNGVILFFLDEKDVENAFLFAEKIVKNVPPSETMHNSQNAMEQIEIRFVTVPIELDIEKYIKWALKIVQKINGRVTITPHTSTKFTIQYSRGTFFRRIVSFKLNRAALRSLAPKLSKHFP